MKISALVTVLALTCGAALAQTSSSSTNRDASTTRSNSAAAASEKSSDEGFVAKTKDALHRMGDATRNAMHRITSAGRKSTGEKTENASKSDTRSMGAAGSDTQDSGRRARMDEAYSNSKKQQQK